MTDPEASDAGAEDERGQTPPPRSRPSGVDPEDWAAAPADDDEHYQRERPPHWE